jgi:hypothetical protein
MMHKYEIIIYWSREDDLFVTEVPELPTRGHPMVERLAER